MMARMGALASLVNGLLFYLLFSFLLSCAAYRFHGARSDVPEKERRLNGNMCSPDTCALCLSRANSAVTHLDVSHLVRRRCWFFLELLAADFLDGPSARWPAGHNVGDSYK